MFARFRFDAKRAREGDEGAEPTQRHGEPTSDDETGGVEPTTAEPTDARRVRVKREPAPEPPAAAPKWQERWHAICAPCFEACRACDHHAERRLRLLIVGHNPSDHAWMSGYSYSNPSNRFWNLLRGELAPLTWRGILPADAPLAEQNHLPSVYGVGMTSIGLEPGNDAASYGKETMARWRADFFRRLRLHIQRVCVAEHGRALAAAPCELPHSPMLVAFSGKRQFSHLFSPPLAKVEHFGRQTRLPPGWPRECLADNCEVWVLPSSSGRAAMTTAQRAAPYQQLAARFHELPWPSAATTNGAVKREEGDDHDDPVVTKLVAS